jgi:opacity protein-like surface antigen
MIKHLISTLILIFITALALQAGDIQRHGVTAHIGGAGTLFEFEYQYRFFLHDKNACSVCVGVNSVGFNVGFPIGFNYIYGQKNQLLLGVRFVPNILFSSFDEEVEVPFWSYLANLRIGYGRELLLFKENFTLFIYASPFMNLGSGRVLPWAGVGLTSYF